MIIVTGAAGFIGSCLVNKLNNKGYTDIVLVDDFTNPVKNLNLKNKVFRHKVDREVFLEWLRDHHRQVNFVFHLGARTDTTEMRKAIFDKLNLNYSKQLWTACARYDLPMIYASSAATYGAGKLGYDDDHALIAKLKPLNPYGESKNEFDRWVLQQKEKPYFWAGFKFFNVFGPNEYHKGRMASVVYHTFNKIKESGKMDLFRSHHPDFKDGEQKRDFIYVKDVVNVLFYFMLHKDYPGIFNLGTGNARTFLDLSRATFEAMGKEADVHFVDTPEDIRDKYQYFTEAKMDKLRQAGYNLPFYALEEAIADYVQDYLLPGSWY
ncbi:MAG: ADP-glyceromanno-heptose 6-epimerase [Bacteroidales bacterium]|jgi:ADP-L-glycero-D-manno-heptose 6-epimerase|nr:ADP-glyceromanno-heptose 6-epimerase [Bacteroidales bacterium]NLM93336.1 ADP-glyceromanno-heptose 6-epimerase [Bacteroidales bacterium]